MLILLHKMARILDHFVGGIRYAEITHKSLIQQKDTDNDDDIKMILKFIAWLQKSWLPRCYYH